jgi:hypothetical protein
MVGVLMGALVFVGGTRVGVDVGDGVSMVRTLVGMTAPGVRKTSIHTGWVRTAGSMACTNSLGRFGKKSASGLSLDPMSASNLQREEKRSAHSPARITNRSPNKRIIATIIQSRRSCSISFIGMSIHRQPYNDGCAGEGRLIETGALKPDTPVVGVDNATGDGKSQTRTAAFEFGLP